jgi:hypothetical protein
MRRCTPQRTAGPRSAWPDRAAGSHGAGATGRELHGVCDGPAVCRTVLGFSGGHSSVGHTPHGGTTPETPRQRARTQCPPQPFPRPPQRTAGPRSAGRIDRSGRDADRDPLAGSIGTNGTGVRASSREHGVRESPAVCDAWLGFSGAGPVRGSHTIWGSNPEKPRQRAQAQCPIRRPHRAGQPPGSRARAIPLA